MKLAAWLMVATALALDTTAASAQQAVDQMIVGDDLPGFGQAPPPPPQRPNPPVDGCQDFKPLNFKPSDPGKPSQARLDLLDQWKTELEGKLGLKNPVNAQPTPCDIWLPSGPKKTYQDKIGVTYRVPPDDNVRWTCTVRIEETTVGTCQSRKLKWLLAHEMCHCKQLERKDPQPLNETQADSCATDATGIDKPSFSSTASQQDAEAWVVQTETAAATATE